MINILFMVAWIACNIHGVRTTDLDQQRIHPYSVTFEGGETDTGTTNLNQQRIYSYNVTLESGETDTTFIDLDEKVRYPYLLTSVRTGNTVTKYEDGDEMTIIEMIQTELNGYLVSTNEGVYIYDPISESFPLKFDDEYAIDQLYMKSDEATTKDDIIKSSSLPFKLGGKNYWTIEMAENYFVHTYMPLLYETPSDA